MKLYINNPIKKLAIEFKTFCHVICFLLFFAFVQDAYSQLDNTALVNFDSRLESEDSITQLIKETDFFASTDISQYNINIIKLKKTQNKFTSYQQCYFDYLVAYKYVINGDFKFANEQLNDLFAKCDDNLSNKIRIKTVLANIQVISRDYELSIDSLDFALGNIDEAEDDSLKHMVYATSALVYRLINQNELSLKFSQLLINQNPNNHYLCKGLTNQYRIYLKTESPLISESDILNSIEICKSVKSDIYANLMRLDWLKHKLKLNSNNTTVILNLLAQLQSFNSEIDEIKYSNLISIKDSMFAKLYHKLNDLPNMLKHAKLSLETSKSIGDTKQKLEVLSLLINYYRKNNNTELAFKYLKQKSESEKNYSNEQQAKTMAYQNAKHNNLAKTHEIEQLNHENNLLALENTLNHKTSIIQQLIISLLVVLFSFVVFWIIRVKKTQAMYKHMSETDGMTGIYNRKGLKDYIEEVLDSAKKGDRSIAYAIFDLDDFKKINDLYGHIKGDWVIKNTIKQCQLIQSDKVTFGRIGGEEFAIVMRDSSSNELAKFCEECRKLIANIDSSPTGYDFSVSASFGVTSTTISGYVYSDLMTDADNAMYDAKAAGRNMVVNFQNNKIN